VNLEELSEAVKKLKSEVDILKVEVEAWWQPLLFWSLLDYSVARSLLFVAFSLNKKNSN
jgi:hypothetical protein